MNERAHSGPDVELMVRHRRRLVLGLLIDRVALASAVALFALGLVLLGVRRFSPSLTDLLPLIGVGLAGLALAAGIVMTWRARWRTEDLAAWVDWRSQAGGLALALAEKPDPRWSRVLEERLARGDLPRLAWRVPVRRVAPAALFAIIAAVVPITPTAATRPNAAGIGVVLRLEERLDRLAAEQLLAREEEQTLRRELARLEREIRHGKLGAREWEAADSIRSRLDDKVSRVLRTMTRSATALNEMKAVEPEPGAAWPRQEQGELERSLLELDSEHLFAKELEGLDLAHLDDWLERVEADPLELSDLDAEALARALGELEAFLAARAAHLGDCDCDGAALALLLDELQGPPTRGRADAPLIHGEPDRQLEGLRAELVRGRRVTPETSRILRVTTEAPDATPDALAERGRAREFADTDQEATWKRSILPRHRGVVRRYFTREQDR